MQPLNRGGAAAIVCDVLVAGGGVAGAAAAVSASREGCRVVLAEREQTLGGIGTRGMLRTLCGLYRNGAAEPAETLNAGLVREIVSALLSASPRRRVQRIGKVFVLPYDGADLDRILLALCRQEANLTMFLGSAAVAVTAESGRVTEITLDRGGTRQGVQPQAVIDCTGDGAVAVMAGAEFDLASPEEIQMAGYTVRVRGLRDRDEALALKVPYALAEAVRSQGLSPGMRFTTFSQGDVPDEGYLKFSVESAGGEERDQRVPEDIARALRFLSDRLPAFRDAVVVGTSPGALEREGRRILGEYVLTEDDVLSAKKFSDGIVKNAWPIELWDRKKGALYKYVPAGDYYEIPFRCLRVKGFSNLLAAGRCISATHEALGSTRVMGACMALGDQAGRAAAELVRTGKYPEFSAAGK